MTSTKCKVNEKVCEQLYSTEEIIKYFLGIENISNYKVQNILFKSDGSMDITLSLKGRRGRCPCCGKSSYRRHSTYARFSLRMNRLIVEQSLDCSR